MKRGTTAFYRHVFLAVAMLTLLPVPAAVAAQPVAQAPRVHFQVPGSVTDAALPLVVSWPAATPDGSPIYRYTLQRSLDGGPWTGVPLPSRLARAKSVKLRAWQVIAFRVRAEDEAGNLSDWAQAAPVWLSTAQEDDPLIDLTSGWAQVSDAQAFRGMRVTSSADGESATFEFTGREVAWIAQRGPLRGEADIYLDGTLARSVDLYKATTVRQRLVFRAQWAAAGEHTLTIVNRGTPQRSNVDLDAIAVIGSPTDQTLVGAGDIASCAQEVDQATADLVETVEGIVFTAGDNVYPDGSANYFASCYEPTWGAFRARTRPAPGNHDYYNNPGAVGYFDYFGANAGPHGRGWYRYEAGTWRIYSLTSECRASSACGLAQLEWLRADLAAEPHRCVAAYWHRPRWSTGPHGDSPRMAGLVELLHDAGAEMVIAGHDHSYQRFAPAAPDGSADPVRGVRQFIVGTGGAALYGFPSEHALLEVRDNTSHGVLRLDLEPGSYSWQFLPVPGDAFTDSGTRACH